VASKLLGWRTKAGAQRVFSMVPGGHRVNYAFQRRVFGNLPMSDPKLDEVIALGRHHVDVLRAHGTAPIEEARFYEFGAGWDLNMPLILASLGVTRQLVVDIRPLVRADLVFEIARRLSARAATEGFTSPLDASAGDGDLSAFLAAHGIEYRAPCDARATGLPDGSIDYATSTNTLEHIPPDDLLAILTESRRLLAPGGVLSFQIDYQDHYSYFDRRLTAYNFLRFPRRRWRLYNSALHFQSRLRHRDYVDLFHQAGLEIRQEETTGGSADDINVVQAIAHPEWRANYELAELAVRGARVVLAARLPTST